MTSFFFLSHSLIIPSTISFFCSFFLPFCYCPFLDIVILLLLLVLHSLFFSFSVLLTLSFSLSLFCSPISLFLFVLFFYLSFLFLLLPLFLKKRHWLKNIQIFKDEGFNEFLECFNRFFSENVYFSNDQWSKKNKSEVMAI